jgi:hypothetical protein
MLQVSIYALHVILQDDLHCAIGNFGREHPFGDDGKAGVRKDGGAQPLRGSDTQPPLQRNGNLRALGLPRCRKDSRDHCFIP